MKAYHIATVSVVVVSVSIGAAGAQDIYWAEAFPSMIRRHRIGSDAVDTVVSTFIVNPNDLAIDPVNRRAYWTEPDRGEVRSATLDGGDIRTIASSPGAMPTGVAVASDGNAVYWTDSASGAIWRFDADSESVVEVLSGLAQPYRVAASTVAQSLFWSDRETGQLLRASLDGGNVAVLVDSVAPNAVVASMDGERLYWADDAVRCIELATGVQTVIVQGFRPILDLALDEAAGVVRFVEEEDGVRSVSLNGGPVAANLPDVEDVLAFGLADERMYWIQAEPPALSSIAVAGSGVTTLVRGIDPAFLAFDAQNQQLYWTDSKSKGVFRSDTTGGPIDRLESGGPLPVGVAVDSAAGVYYWSELVSRTIRMAPLDGSASSVSIHEDVAARGLALSTSGNTLYWTDTSGAIGRIQLGTLDTDYIAEGLEEPRDLALDEINGFVYWTDFAAGKVLRTSLYETSVVETVHEGLDSPRGIAVDTASDTLLWVEFYAGRIRRSGLSGGAVTDLLTGLDSPGDVIVDSTASCVFWTERGTRGLIGRINLDGTDPEVVHGRASSESTDLVMHHELQRMYWTDPDGGRILSAQFDGSEIQVFLEGLDLPHAIDVDPTNGRIFWSEREAIVVADLIEPQPMVLAEASNYVRDLAYDPLHEAIIWVQHGSPSIYTRPLEGGETTILVALNQQRPASLIVDPLTETLYWIDLGQNGFTTAPRIQRVNLDGTGSINSIVSAGLEFPARFALDSENGVIYWVDSGQHRIERCDIDGTDRRVILSHGVDEPYAVGLDLAGHRLVWADHGPRAILAMSTQGTTRRAEVSQFSVSALTADFESELLYWATAASPPRIYRSHIDGSQIEPLITAGIADCESIAIDTASEHIYWIDRDWRVIKRAALDGSGVEDLCIFHLSWPHKLRVDSLNGHLYWLDHGPDEIVRSDLNANNRVTVVPEIYLPRTFALSAPLDLLTWVAYEDIWTSRLDGSDSAEIESDIASISSLAMSSGTGRIFRTEVSSSDRIMSTSLDGADPIVHLSGLTNPYELLVDDSGIDCNANGVVDSEEVVTGPGTDCNYNGRPDSCDLADFSSEDANRNAVPDECECEEACGDVDSDGIVDDVCVWSTCGFGESSVCYAVARIHGDVVGGTSCLVDGVVDSADLAEVGRCFEGRSACNTVMSDVGGSFGACAPDGYCNVHDMTHQVRVIQGTSTCTCGGAAPEGIMAVDGAIGILLEPELLHDGRIALTAMVDRAVEDLQSFQLSLRFSGAASGYLSIDRIETSHAESLFGQEAGYVYSNPRRGQIMAGQSTRDGRRVGARTPLATFVVVSSPNATGRVYVSVSEESSASAFLSSSGRYALDFKPPITVELRAPPRRHRGHERRSAGKGQK